MHFVTAVDYIDGYKLRLAFEDGSVKDVDLAPYLDGEVFEPLKDQRSFRSARLNTDLDTVTWENGADMSPDFLYDIGVATEATPMRRVAEERSGYATKTKEGAVS
jgi:hypothetical protein